MVTNQIGGEGARHGRGQVTYVNEGSELPKRAPLELWVVHPRTPDERIDIVVEHARGPKAYRRYPGAVRELNTELLALQLGLRVLTNWVRWMVVIDREIGRLSPAKEAAQYINAAQINAPGETVLLCGAENVSGPADIRLTDAVHRGGCRLTRHWVILGFVLDS